MKKYAIFIFGAISLIGCKNSQKEAIISDQKLLYDSTQTNDKSFKVTIITTLELNNSIKDEYLNGFYIIVKRDTFPLNIKRKSIHEEKNKRIIEYSTLLKQKAREFEDNIFVDSIKNYKIKNKNSTISVIKSPDYSISSLITLWKNNDKNKVQ